MSHLNRSDFIRLVLPLFAFRLLQKYQKTMKYEEYFTAAAKEFRPSYIRSLQKHLGNPEMINFGGGLPNAKTFVGINMDTTSSLQYSKTMGEDALLNHLHNLQTKMHGKTSSILVGCGSQDLITKTFQVLLEDGQELVIESPTYLGILAYLRPRKMSFLPVEVDNEGLNPKSIRKWVQTNNPRVLYTVATAGNPSGATTSRERKLEILKLAQEFNFLILEDDPYYYLQFNDKVF